MYTTLISAAQLQALQHSDTPHMVFDCTFDLSSPDAGHAQYRQAHIAGALYAHLDHDLSAHHGAPGLAGEVLAALADAPASGGRHPLPSRERFATWLSSIGFANGMQAIVYDRNGANFCGRLWWMLKWAGHHAVAVLDGGLAGWQADGGEVARGDAPSHFQTNFELDSPLVTLLATQDIAGNLRNPARTLVDARAAPRYRGEVEPIDRAAGHIPGALNRPFSSNLGPDGKFKSSGQLKEEFDALLAGRDPASVVHYCGSGASAVPNVLAMQIAGFQIPALYAGSWSEWCSDPARPVELG